MDELWLHKIAARLLDEIISASVGRDHAIKIIVKTFKEITSVQ